MPSYARQYEILIGRALRGADVDLETFFEQAIEVGMTPEQAEAALLDDLENDGPIFGKLKRSFLGAAEAPVMEAERQGSFAGQLSGSAALRDIEQFNEMDIDALLDAADPDALAELEDIAAPVVRMIWVADLVNTCHRCLPLHGTALTAEEWRARGLHPSSIHAGWNSSCHCRLVVEDIAAPSRKELMDPLVRNPVKPARKGLEVSRRSKRSVLQEDIDRARAAVAEASQSIEGRRMLRLLGKSKGSR